jgi:hypothetical protein
MLLHSIILILSQPVFAPYSLRLQCLAEKQTSTITITPPMRLEVCRKDQEYVNRNHMTWSFFVNSKLLLQSRARTYAFKLPSEHLLHVQYTVHLSRHF